MRVIGVYSIKGGVGKTTAAVNLAYLSSRGNHGTLIWDLDPQAASTYYFRVKPRVRGGAGKLLRKKRAIDDRIKATDFPGLDLLPADESYRNLDLLLDDLERPRRGIRKVLSPVADEYEHVFLDCPPSLSLLSESVFRAAEVLVVPVIPTPLSLRTLAQLDAFLAREKLSVKVVPFLSMIDRRKKLHRDIADELAATQPNLAAAEIPYASVIEQMSVHRAPVATYARWSAPSEAFERLWRAVKKQLRA